MIIIQMAGGLGNQMFQYALYRQLISMGKIVKMDDEAGFKADAQRNPALEAFGIPYEKASRKEIIRMTDASMMPLTRLRRKLLGRHSHSYFEESKLFQAKIFGWDNVYLEGYWQSEKYFPDVADVLKQEFGLESVINNKCNGYGLSEQAQRLLQRIQQTESVSIHVRRGDYLLPQNQELFGGICTDLYYERAMKIVADRYPNCTFYLFTNDWDWADGWLKRNGFANQVMKEGHEMIPVCLPEDRDYESLTLMSQCKHNILANSSFSWWASYLNGNPDKFVAAPDKWLNGWDCSDIYRADMVKIKPGI
ncbi:MAG: alpha-1,2-fucosyltransferase [Bacillus sp. (in: Bacteria)]|nr:alpha-1,2-fucosyltransferase [Bacillus sp. (in: firmicutes)]MCM1425472.1 alpha-1,2-fucosyltransferase [Eubacterium sp.]